MAKPGPLLARWEQHTLEKEIRTPMMKAASTIPAAMQEPYGYSSAFRHSQGTAGVI